MFAQAGVQFEDVRFTSEQWAEFKPKTPYGVMPVLDIDGKIVGGSMPIVRYLARQYGLDGGDDMARLILEGAADAIEDFKKKMFALYFDFSGHLSDEALAKYPGLSSSLRHLTALCKSSISTAR